jgi:phosphatidate phosphatase APP1
VTPRRPWYAHGHRLEQRWDAWRGALKARLGWRTPAMIQAFRGYGDGARVRLKGRVLELGGRERWRQRTGRWSDLVRMYHRFATDEVPGARVRATFAGRTVETVSDEEGYFEVALDGFAAAAPPGELWRPLQLDLLAPLAAARPPVQVAAPVLVPPAAAGFAVVSDIDDTIVRTGATSLVRNLRTTLLTSIEARVAFKGIGAFYRALELGGGAAVVNPIFYVSSSPWNLYDLLERFIELNGIPLGPLFLRDLGWDASKFIRSRHEDHKLGAIETLLDFYPGLRFILIGDSGQHDAVIYREVVRRHPGRILAVYIRELARHSAQGSAARAQLDAVRAAGVEAVLCPTLLRAADHAAAQGWIAAPAVQAVQAEVEEQTRAA